MLAGLIFVICFLGARHLRNKIAAAAL